MLSSVLRNKIAKTVSVESAVELFLRRQEARARSELNAVIGELQHYIWEHYGDIPKAQILDSVATTLDGFGIKADLARLDGLYVNTAKAVVVSAKLGEFVFDKVDDQTLNAIRKNFFWLGDNASQKTRDRLYEIVESAFKGDVARADLA